MYSNGEAMRKHQSSASFARVAFRLSFLVAAAFAPAARAQQPAGYTMTDLGPASPHSSPAWLYGDAVSTVSINGAGDVVAATPTASGYAHAALFHNGKVIDLGTLGGPNSSAIAINDAVQIEGNSDRADGTTHAFLYAAGVMTDLGAVSAVTINASGQILVSDSSFASVYSNGAMQPLPLPQCNGSPFQYGAAYSMNDSGEVVGEAWAWWGSHLVCDDAILISGGQAKDIGFWPWGFSTAIAINRSGHILGKGWTNCDGVVCDQEYTFLDGAFLFYALSTPDSSGWSSLLGSAINDAGQIAGIGNNANGQRAFLMTPIPSPTVSITSP